MGLLGHKVVLFAIFILFLSEVNVEKIIMRVEINYIINVTYVETNFLEKHIFFFKKGHTIHCSKKYVVF